MLLEGSYLGDVEKVVESFRLIRREMIREGQIDVSWKGRVTIDATQLSFDYSSSGSDY